MLSFAADLLVEWINAPLWESGASFERADA
jgi:hypothetical protein